MPGYGISALLDHPFFEGAHAVGDEVPWPFPVALGGHSYIIDLAQYQRATLPPIRATQDVTAEASESAVNVEGLWRRNQNSWHYGAGQQFFDAKQDTDRRRFGSSRGVDIWTPFQLTLLNAVANKHASSSGAQRVLETNGYLYHFMGDDGALSANPDAETPTWTNLTGEQTTLNSVTSDGGRLYLAYSGGTAGIYRVALGTAAIGAVWSTAMTGFTLVAYANGRLVAGAGPRVVELDDTGILLVGGLDFTHRMAGFTFNCSAPAPNALYLGGNSGDRSEILYVTVDPDTGSLRVPVHAGALPNGEQVRCMDAFERVVVIGSTKGVRVATIADDNSLNIGPLIAAPGSVADLAIDNRFAWFSWSNYSLDALSPGAGVGRLDLSRFTDDLTPAYASDVMAAQVGTVGSVARFGGRTYFTIDGSGGGLFGETGSKVVEGELVTSKILFGTHELKVPALGDVRHDPLIGSVQMLLRNEAGVTVSIGSDSVQDSLGPNAAFPVSDFSCEWFEVILRLSTAAGSVIGGGDTWSTISTTWGTESHLWSGLLGGSSSPGEGPTLRRWTVKAAVVPEIVDEIMLPIILKPLVNDDVGGEGADHGFDVLAEYQYLQGLQLAGLTTYQEGTQSYRARVKGLELPAGSVDDWMESRAFFESIMRVRLHILVNQET